jgi:hypothetical protein
MGIDMPVAENFAPTRQLTKQSPPSPADLRRQSFVIVLTN